MSDPSSLLQWIDLHPQSYLWPVGGLIALTLARAVSPLLEDQHQEDRRHDWWWSLAILAILVAGRWPTFLFSRELGVDESQLLAGAHALTDDPVFWRSVNGGTAGPLDFFALCPAGWLCGWNSYLPARLTAVALLATSLIFAHQVMALILGRQTARVAGLAALSLEALTNSADFLHYSTELLPVALLSVATYAAIRRWTLQGGPLWSGLGGLILGCVPLSKSQAVPLAATMGLCWLWAELRAKDPPAFRHRIYLLTGALLPTALFACQLTIAGEWESAVTSYVIFHFHYATENQFSLGTSLLVMLENSLWWDSLLPLALLGILVWLALLVRLRALPHQPARFFMRAVLAALFVALASIIGPKRPYLHYWQLLLLPSIFLLGAMIARLLATSPPRWRKPEQWLVALCAVALIGGMLFHRGRNPNIFMGSLNYCWHHPRTDLADRVASHSRPGEALAIWGRTDNIYVETGLRQATRDSHFAGLVDSGPLQQYGRDRFLADLVFTNPESFLDSAGPASLHYTQPRYAHDRNYPELAAVIRANYVLVEEFAGSRLYRRRDLVTR